MNEPLTADPLVQQAFLKAFNTGEGNHFGYSVDISWDSQAVEADGESSNATGINGSERDNSTKYTEAAYVESGLVESRMICLPLILR